jgi:DNA mismatch repair ATPase MutL
MIAKLGSDLFILDQHACDEKYQFETFQSQASLRSQRMVNSQPMEINVAGELVVLDHLVCLTLFCFILTIGTNAIFVCTRKSWQRMDLNLKWTNRPRQDAACDCRLCR